MARQNKVSKTLLKEISSIIQYELKDHRLGFITITDVELTEDLRYAKVYFSVLGSDQQQKQSLSALEHATGFIRRLISQRIKLRFVPEIVFKIDKSIEYGLKIEEELRKIKDEYKKNHSSNSKTR